MAHVLNDPSSFMADLTSGFAKAHANWVQTVPGGVVRATEVPEGQVAVITGGGSGHYPAFAGLVGPGLAHGAAMGNIFASPSAQQIYNVAKAAHAGGGVLLTYGNYAGDVLNFNLAQERLIAEGISCKTVVITDDIASASPEEASKRRGIAGGLIVYKVAAAAAEAGKTLDEVFALASAANEHTRSLGVAFSGATLPGADQPLFTVPKGRMAVGMGIHGEPGISEQDIPTATGLAEMLVQRLLSERPAESQDRAVVLLNGLGGVKYEELFVLYDSIATFLSQAGVEIFEPEVGELVTSFEMAGLSLTLSWLTPELAEYWSAPANTPAYRKGNLALGARRVDKRSVSEAQEHIVPASAASKAAANVAVDLIEAVEEAIRTNVERLGKLDEIAGDGDHGIGMYRGAHAAAESARSNRTKGLGVGTLLRTAAEAWGNDAGGTSGALWSVILTAIAEQLGDEGEILPARLEEAVQKAVSAAQKFGGAKPGDKTMIDALVPYATAFTDAIKAQKDIRSAVSLAAEAAAKAAQETAQLIPQIGRARPHAEKSLGTPDPGAVSFAIIAETISDKTQQYKEH